MTIIATVTVKSRKPNPPRSHKDSSESETFILRFQEIFVQLFSDARLFLRYWLRATHRKRRNENPRQSSPVAQVLYFCLSLRTLARSCLTLDITLIELRKDSLPNSLPLNLRFLVDSLGRKDGFRCARIEGGYLRNPSFLKHLPYM